MQVTTSDRGFERVEFVDANSQPFNLAQSSVDTSALWLGHANHRAHLSRQQVEAVCLHLQAWLATGSLYVPDGVTVLAVVPPAAVARPARDEAHRLRSDLARLRKACRKAQAELEKVAVSLQGAVEG